MAESDAASVGDSRWYEIIPFPGAYFLLGCMDKNTYSQWGQSPKPTNNYSLAMSQIANALAKAKERPGTQAPFMSGATTRPDATAVAARKRFSANIIWAVVLAGSIGTAGAVFWMSRKTEASAATVAAVSVPDVIAPVAGTNAGVIAAGTPTTPAAALARMTRNESAVRQLSISAVLPGEQPRIMANGRVYYVGDIILPPEISFAGTDNGQLVFTDLAGNRFIRRF